MLHFDLPYPPSVNHYWRRVGARTLISRAGRAFRERVCSLLAARRIEPLDGPLAMRIDVFPPDHRRRDIDNLQKALLDALQQPAVVAVTVFRLQPDNLCRLVKMFLVEIAGRDLDNVVLLGVLFFQTNVSHALFARADVGHGDPVIRPRHIGRRRLVLPIDWRLEQAGRARGSSEHGGLAEEGAARFAPDRIHSRRTVHTGCATLPSHSVAH